MGRRIGYDGIKYTNATYTFALGVGCTIVGGHAVVVHDIVGLTTMTKSRLLVLYTILYTLFRSAVEHVRLRFAGSRDDEENADDWLGVITTWRRALTIDLNRSGVNLRVRVGVRLEPGQ